MEKKNDEIIRKNSSYHCNISNQFNSNLFSIPLTRISNMRYNLTKKENGSYVDSFNYAAQLIEQNCFKNLRIISFDPEELILCFLVDDPCLWNIKYLMEIFLDGTFKTKYWRGSHYCILVFATVLRKSMRTVPFAFCISFNGTSDRYAYMWKRLMLFLSRKRISLKYLCVMSDVGKSEIKFIKSIKKFGEFYCWYHVYHEILIPRIQKIMKDNDELLKIYKNLIIKIYCSKTVERRVNKVKQFTNLLKEHDEKLLNWMIKEGYLGEKLNKWTSLLKISQYRDHTNNFIENCFNFITNKNSAKQRKAPILVKKINDMVENVFKKHYDYGEIMAKKQALRRTFQDGITIFKFSEYKEESKKFCYEVKSKCSKRKYFVDLFNFFCSCSDFNTGAYPCNHIFAMLVKVRVEYGHPLVDIENMDTFSFINKTRSLIVKCKSLVKYMNLCDFPVTISEECWKNFYDI